MKVTFNIDCTPEEARKFFGLPDVVPMQEMMMKEIEAKMQDNIQNLDPESFMKTWMPATIQGWGEMQKLFWAQMGVDPSKMPGFGAMSGGSSEEK